jgi:predicted lipoprotein with Yx(FWY)xxD motif
MENPMKLKSIRRLLLPLSLATAVLGAGAIGATAALAHSTMPTAHAAKATVVSARKTSHGTVLVGPNGRTLYLWEADSKNKSKCTGSCAQAWPLLTTTGKVSAGGGVKGSLLKVIARHQVSYNGHPLYYYVGDTKAGQTSGEGSDGFGAQWFVVNTSGNAVK